MITSGMWYCFALSGKKLPQKVVELDLESELKKGEAVKRVADVVTAFLQVCVCVCVCMCVNDKESDNYNTNVCVFFVVVHASRFG